MNKKEILPGTPLENIADIVRRQFREQVAKDLATPRRGRPPKNDDIDLPAPR